MKNKFLFAFLFASIASFSQDPFITPQGSTSEVTLNEGGSIDSLLTKIPVRSSTDPLYPDITYQGRLQITKTESDTLFQWHNGADWITVGSGSGSSGLQTTLEAGSYGQLPLEDTAEIVVGDTLEGGLVNGTRLVLKNEYGQANTSAYLQYKFTDEDNNITDYKVSPKGMDGTYEGWSNGLGMIVSAGYNFISHTDNTWSFNIGKAYFDEKRAILGAGVKYNNSMWEMSVSDVNTGEKTGIIYSEATNQDILDMDAFAIGMTVRDDIYGKGLTNHEDYSANYTDRSLVDKGYVDAAIASAGSPVWGDITGDVYNQEDIITVIDDAISSIGNPSYLAEEAGDFTQYLTFYPGYEPTADNYYALPQSDGSTPESPWVLPYIINGQTADATGQLYFGLGEVIPSTSSDQYNPIATSDRLHFYNNPTESPDTNIVTWYNFDNVDTFTPVSGIKADGRHYGPSAEDSEDYTTKSQLESATSNLYPFTYSTSDTLFDMEGLPNYWQHYTYTGTLDADWIMPPVNTYVGVTIYVYNQGSDTVVIATDEGGLDIADGSIDKASMNVEPGGAIGFLNNNSQWIVVMKVL